MPKSPISRSNLNRARDSAWKPSARLHRSTESASTRIYALRNRTPVTIATDAGKGDEPSYPQAEMRSDTSNAGTTENQPLQSNDRFEDLVDALKLINQCGVCREVLSGPYRECGHTFCAACLNGVIESNRRMRINFRHYHICPECHAPIKSIPLQSFVVGHTVNALHNVLGATGLPSVENIAFTAEDIYPLRTSLPRFSTTNAPARQIAPFPLSP
ncbi:hypothetical protein EV361DRAFT_954385 [Lentinula raphanica]|nr:hypothetical protein EV361DRAFT_954385 [Lentinula raphanica]